MEGEGEGFLLGGQWKEKEKVFCLVDNGRRRRRFFAWWKEKEKVFCLVASGRRRKMIPTFPPSNFT